MPTRVCQVTASPQEEQLTLGVCGGSTVYRGQLPGMPEGLAPDCPLLTSLALAQGVAAALGPGRRDGRTEWCVLSCASGRGLREGVGAAERGSSGGQGWLSWGRSVSGLGRATKNSLFVESQSSPS